MSQVRKWLGFLLSILVLVSAFAFIPTPALADTGLTFTVNSSSDLPDLATNSVCSAGQPTGGPCTLRAAISEANGNIDDGPVTILVPPGTYTLVISPSSTDDNNHGDFDISATNATNLVTIKALQKGTVVINTLPGFTDRILEVGWHAKVLIQDITFSGASLVLTTPTTGGGAIVNAGYLTLEGTVFQNNSVTCATPNACQASLIGGAILNSGGLTIVDSSFIHNAADRGWAIFNSGGAESCVITYSSFFDNTGLGGTITNYSSLSITNSTLSGNHSSMFSPSGIINEGQLVMQSCTLANNGDVSSIFNVGGAFVSDSIFVAQLGMKNFNNDTTNWTSGGYNIFSDNSWPGILSNGDLLNTDPLLGNLGNWGGPTLTHALLDDSPAINHRPNSCFTPLYSIEDDQRHQRRVDGHCDTGSFELGRIFLPLIRR